MDRGSPNTAWVTQAFFQHLEVDLSFARVRRPTNNAITERLYGSIKQEEIYLMGNDPDETSAREEIGRGYRPVQPSPPPSGLHELYARVCPSDQ